MKNIHIHLHGAKTKDARSKAEVESDLDHVQEQIEMKEDQGVTVPPALRDKRKSLQAELKALSESVKAKDAVASSAIRSHKQFTQADYDYFKSKGWSDAEILKRWDEEGKKNVPPQRGNKNAKSGEPGYNSAFGFDKAKDRVISIRVK